VARVDIECLQDRAIFIETQRAMQSALPRREVVGMTSGHCQCLPQSHDLAAQRVCLA
jgi:hypothetical protein